ncbi:hypothetical protein ACE1CI_03350 [Aerosakkonemataceae cyanobacterium BLCC-F50]|uniref:Uncharacterized protein n=1 Tax=Floridaenema flaviceps BLCC-F50 TaxID=3153642 RepID=A0ABV4XL17_9CYAN
MPIRILPKYNSGNPEPDRNKPTENSFSRLNAKLKYEREYIQPVLGDLFRLYRHDCIIFISGKYVGRGYGFYEDNRDEDYEKVGQLLAQI